MATTEPIRDPKLLEALSRFYLEKGEIRNHLLVILGIHTALRISDILRLTWDAVYDFDAKRLRETVVVQEKKTRKTKIVKLNEKVLNVLRLCLYAAKPGKPLILNKRTGKAISRIQAYRLIRAASEALAFPAHVSCHSLRKTFGYLAWKNGISIAVIMEIYNHSSYAITRRYLGILQDDKNEAYNKLAQVV